MNLTIIAAMDRNRLIGRDNALPWHMPADLRHFKAATLGKPVLMGRKTCQSLPCALPGRRNLVLTHNPDFSRPGFETVSLDDLRCRDSEEVMVIGGAGIYRLFLPQARRMLITHIDAALVGDAWFPAWDESQWRVVSRRRREADEKNPFACEFVEYHRISDGSKH